MPLVGECCVNLSGRNVTVTDGNNHAIGELMNREFFTVVGAEGSLVAIYFLGPSGQPLRGYLNNAPASSKTPYPHPSIWNSFAKRTKLHCFYDASDDEPL